MIYDIYDIYIYMNFSLWKLKDCKKDKVMM